MHVKRAYVLVAAQWWPKKLNRPNALDINASIDSKRNSDHESAGELVTKETRSSKMEKPNIPKFCGDVRERNSSDQILSTRLKPDI